MIQDTVERLKMLQCLKFAHLHLCKFIQTVSFKPGFGLSSQLTARLLPRGPMLPVVLWYS